VDDAEVAFYRDYAAGHLASLRRLAFLICGNWHLAEDAVSTVMTKLYVIWPKIRRDDNVDAYVRRMLVRAIADERRRPWRRESPAEHLWADIEAPGPDGPDALSDQLVLRAALAQMPPRRRAVLVLRYFEELTVEETAAVMGCSTGTVKSQTARALAAMREKLPPDFLVEERITS
jgi:RNA polymerase sigma-70 factor (sigma-E family)